MGKTLIIAEKPSVAKDIAAVLSVSRSGEYYENNELIISNCIGHLVEINVPESESRNAPHPIIPEVFGLKEIPDTKKQFKLIKSLMHRSDVSCVVNACDAGREGELIFRLSYELAGCNKPRASALGMHKSKTVEICLNIVHLLTFSVSQAA